MTKLTDMSLEELWELFPIALVAPREEWGRQYAKMEERLCGLLAEVRGLRISHVGSTAIEGIWAKDIVDVLVEVGPEEDLDAVARTLERNGFLRMSESGTRISLNWGYTPEGFADEVFHVHLRFQGDDDEVYFRDYLNAHPEAAAEYETLKLALWRRHEHDRDAYTEGKTAFVRQVMDAALHRGRRSDVEEDVRAKPGGFRMLQGDVGHVQSLQEDPGRISRKPPPSADVFLYRDGCETVSCSSRTSGGRTSS